MKTIIEYMGEHGIKFFSLNKSLRALKEVICIDAMVTVANDTVYQNYRPMHAYRVKYIAFGYAIESCDLDVPWFIARNVLLSYVATHNKNLYKGCVYIGIKRGDIDKLYEFLEKCSYDTVWINNVDKVDIVVPHTKSYKVQGYGSTDDVFVDRRLGLLYKNATRLTYEKMVITDTQMLDNNIYKTHALIDISMSEICSSNYFISSIRARKRIDIIQCYSSILPEIDREIGYIKFDRIKLTLSGERYVVIGKNISCKKLIIMDAGKNNIISITIENDCQYTIPEQYGRSYPCHDDTGTIAFLLYGRAVILLVKGGRFSGRINIRSTMSITVHNCREIMLSKESLRWFELLCGTGVRQNTLNTLTYIGGYLSPNIIVANPKNQNSIPNRIAHVHYVFVPDDNRILHLHITNMELISLCICITTEYPHDVTLNIISETYISLITIHSAHNAIIMYNNRKLITMTPGKKEIIFSHDDQQLTSLFTYVPKSEKK